MDFSSPSMGGPGICPACDCGIQPDSINHPKNLPEFGRYRFTPNVPSLEDIRRIVREELDRDNK
jgi:hypothetical protein